MLQRSYDHLAEALVFVHGRGAAAEAARHAILCEKSGETDVADTWRRVQSAVVELQDRRRANRIAKAA